MGARRFLWIPALAVALTIGLCLTSGGGDTITYTGSASDGAGVPPRDPVLVGRPPADEAFAPPQGGTDRSTDSDPAAADRADADLADSEDEAQGHIRWGLPLTAAHPLVAPVIEVQERHTRDLMEHPLVVGTATGMNERGDIAVVVLLKEETTDLPASLDGVPVVGFVSGEIFASGRGGKGPDGNGPPGGGGGGGGSKPSIDPTARFARPVPIGVSTGHPDITAGTIGCRVTDGVDLFALSNNHVYANENLAAIHDAVIQPGTFDGGKDDVSDDIGTLSDYYEITFEDVSSGGANTMDAAIALVDIDSGTPAVGDSTPEDGYGRPKKAAYAPAINLRVLKYGRTTAETGGKVYAINATVNVGYDAGVAGFLGQIVVTPGSVSAPGDSGSLFVVRKGGNARKPVGLLFAGSSSVTLASPIGPILTRFGVDVDGD